jgi:hypothetical protein
LFTSLRILRVSSRACSSALRYPRESPSNSRPAETTPTKQQWNI